MKNHITIIRVIQQIEFTSNASHELRTPISILLNELNWASAQDRTIDEYKDSLLTCKKCTEDMKKLIESLLLLARVDEGTRSVMHKAVSLKSVAENAIEALQPFAEKRSLQFSTELQPVEVP